MSFTQSEHCRGSKPLCAYSEPHHPHASRLRCLSEETSWCKIESFGSPGERKAHPPKDTLQNNSVRRDGIRFPNVPPGLRFAPVEECIS